MDDTGKYYIIGGLLILAGIAILYKWLPISVDLQFNSLKTEADVLTVSESAKYECGRRLTGMFCQFGIADKRKNVRFNHELKFGETRVFIKEDTRYKQGEKVKILYLKENPKYSRIIGPAWASHWGTPLAGLLFIIVGVVAIRYEYKNA